MTEHEWLTTDDPEEMLSFIEEGKPSGRKVRLFNAAICRLYAALMPRASRAILRELERLADGLIRVKGEMDLCHRANDVASRHYNREGLFRRRPDEEIRFRRKAAAAACYAVIPGELLGRSSASGR